MVGLSAALYMRYVLRGVVQKSFTALNIEPDYQIDDEVDNTKEIQVLLSFLKSLLV